MDPRVRGHRRIPQHAAFDLPAAVEDDMEPVSAVRGREVVDPTPSARVPGIGDTVAQEHRPGLHRRDRRDLDGVMGLDQGTAELNGLPRPGPAPGDRALLGPQRLPDQLVEGVLEPELEAGLEFEYCAYRISARRRPGG